MIFIFKYCESVHLLILQFTESFTLSYISLPCRNQYRRPRPICLKENADMTCRFSIITRQKRFADVFLLSFCYFFKCKIMVQTANHPSLHLGLYIPRPLCGKKNYDFHIQISQTCLSAYVAIYIHHTLDSLPCRNQNIEVQDQFV